ncbi:MAG: pyrroline-5-carboxylate reductase [Dysgonamonadaceae bacterium]|nr:pyrroline-5-carboxylate reductase [Dysgonamonadaceae bacterium]
MKIVIIGGGNMGGAIARGLVSGSMFKVNDITVIDVNKKPLELLQSQLPGIQTALSDYDSLPNADIIIMAVKPWFIEDVILDIKFKLDYGKQILVSIAAGVTLSMMEKSLSKPKEDISLPALFRVIPNTAIAIGQSMTLVSTTNASDTQKALILKIFNELGKAILMDEDRLPAGIALTSCGIAYLFRYVRAASLAGVELGFYPSQAQELIVNTMKGAAELLLHTNVNPEVEIDKVITPGGITIKGLNELEANGFSDAIIKAIKTSK